MAPGNSAMAPPIMGPHAKGSSHLNFAAKAKELHCVATDLSHATQRTAPALTALAAVVFILSTPVIPKLGIPQLCDVIQTPRDQS